MELTLDEFLLPDCLAQVEGVVRSLAENKSVKLDSELDPEIPALLADETRFRQILYNLLSNAIKFSIEGGRILVKAGRLDDGSVKVDVIDNGIGISSEHLELIFSEFRQVDNSFSRRYEGTGLGLPLTRKLVELHRGRIWVESELGKGSTFTFVIPQRTRDGQALLERVDAKGDRAGLDQNAQDAPADPETAKDAVSGTE